MKRITGDLRPIVRRLHWHDKKAYPTRQEADMAMQQSIAELMKIFSKEVTDNKFDDDYALSF